MGEIVSASMELSRVTLVLDKVRHPDNLGGALRAMKNCGLSRITLADPQTHDFERARTLATDAEDLLAVLEIKKDLRTAVAHGTLVAGTSPRRLERRPSLVLKDFVPRAAAETSAGGEVVVVFGNEQRGLSDTELDLCHVVVDIPTADAKRSLNLSQAVMLVAYECFHASLADRAADAPPPGATAGVLNALYDRMRSALLEAEFLNRENPDGVLSELKRILERARPSPREAELLLTAFKHLERAARQRPPRA
jgi:tRNA/rRNA methyltransferase